MIYTTSATLSAATNTALEGYMEVLTWLRANSLDTDPSKTKLMTFARQCANPNQVGHHPTEARYIDPILGPQTIKTTTHLHYLRVYIDQSLNWSQHVSIMTNHTCSTLRGINLLGNSIHRLDFLNWHKVYNALIIPTLTYGAQVWYTGINQKGLICQLQIAQNEGIRKITGVFKITLVEPLHNLTGIPPISYFMNKLMHSYTNRLQAMAAYAKVQQVLTEDRCHYWPIYIHPSTNLLRAS